MVTLSASNSPVLTGIVILLIVILLASGVTWPAPPGGSWFYLLAGLGFIATAVLLWMRRPAALLVYAALLLATLAWSLWEAGLDWWPLATRLGLLFLLAIWLLLPWVRRGLVARHSEGTKAAASPARARKGWILLPAVTALVILVSVVSWTRDAHRIEDRK